MLLGALDWILRYPIDSFFFIFEDICACPLIEVSFFSPFHQTDPGVPIVYAGFGALMLTTCISYLSHSQVCVIVFHCFN
jgi:hypothetical protein